VKGKTTYRMVKKQTTPIHRFNDNGHNVGNCRPKIIDNNGATFLGNSNRIDNIILY